MFPLRDAKDITVAGTQGHVRIRRLEHGWPHIRAEAGIDRFYGLGFAHGRDRQMQMWLLKLIGQGRASECLRGDEDLIEVDRTMRWIDLSGDAEREWASASPDLRAVFDAYCRGVNDAVAATGRPFEFRAVRYRPDAWTPADALLMAYLVGFAGLARLQGESEKLIVQLLQNGLDAARLQELFPAITEPVSDDFIDIVRSVRLDHPPVPPSIPWHALLPAFSASNNWAVAPRKTASGRAMLCGDPHLDLQLPSVWYPAVMRAGEETVMGATIPGIPAVAIGRSARLAWAATYGTADVCDYFIEEVKGGAYRRGDRWVPLKVREEVVRPKKRPPITLRFHETEHGLLEGDVTGDGRYLAFAWAGKKQKGAALTSMDSVLRVHSAENVEAAMACFANTPFAAFNWVVADREGRIGYQLGGLVPKQAEGASGLLPFLGWDPEQDWQGMVDPGLHPRAVDPPEGFIVTANQDLNAMGCTRPMKLPMSSYRADRIADLLRTADGLTVEEMKRIHYDRFSRQAEGFMEIVRPLLPDTDAGRTLAQWDLRYDADSVGATLFERVYRELVMLVFGEMGLGRAVMEHVVDDSPLFGVLHGQFDRVLLSEAPAWFAGRSREAIFREAISRGLDGEAVPHGRASLIRVEHLFFGGKLPRRAGFDRPLEHIGSRSTIPQAGLSRRGRRTSAWGATFRMICDFAEEGLHVNVAGGASDRRFSRYYASGLREWERGEYLVMEP